MRPVWNIEGCTIAELYDPGAGTFSVSTATYSDLFPMSVAAG